MEAKLLPVSFIHVIFFLRNIDFSKSYCTLPEVERKNTVLIIIYIISGETIIVA